MKRYNLTLKIFANAAVTAASSEAAILGINALLQKEPVLLIGAGEFVLEGGEVTGIYDEDHEELELPQLA